MTSPDRHLFDESRAWLVGLFRDNVDAAFNVAYRLVWNRSDAQDVVQNAFIKAAVARDQLHDVHKARSWLLSITYREALMAIRSRRDLPTDPSELPEDAGHSDDPADVMLQRDLAEIIRSAIDQLPEFLRVAFVLRDVEELSMDDVAGVLDIGASAAKMRVSRAREMLRLSLDGRI